MTVQSFPSRSWAARERSTLQCLVLIGDGLSSITRDGGLLWFTVVFSVKNRLQGLLLLCTFWLVAETNSFHCFLFIVFHLVFFPLHLCLPFSPSLSFLSLCLPPPTPTHLSSCSFSRPFTHYLYFNFQFSPNFLSLSMPPSPLSLSGALSLSLSLTLSLWLALGVSRSRWCYNSLVSLVH